ncbi:MAG: hypothetical protein JRE70_07690 [Deltaproteobacteria bacterium]|nr:hypothetical protein [Deltaproteobacteria bacterium]
MGDSVTRHTGGNQFRGPAKPGEVRNPEGKNQYTYRKDFEKSIGDLLNGELTEAEAESLPEWIREVVEPGMTRGDALAAISVHGALRGDEKRHTELMKRLYPATEKREVTADVRTEGALPVSLPDLANLTKEEQAEARRLGRKAIQKAEQQLEHSAEPEAVAQ